MAEASLDVGGGNPVTFGVSRGRKVLGASQHHGKLYEHPGRAPLVTVRLSSPVLAVFAGLMHLRQSA